MNKINRVIYKGIVACVVAVSIANVVDYFYAALHASAATSGSANFKPSVVINPTATITLSNSSASLAVTPNKNGMFAYTQTPIRVDARTNTPNDVTVNMVPSGSANTLVSGSNSIATLDTTSCATGCATTSSNFLNRWGYNVTTSLSAPSTYLPVLTTANQVLAYNNTAANISNSTATTRYVYFGMKVNQATAPGTYSRALNFTVTVAPDPEPVTMQNATSSKLATLMPNTGNSTTLEDERDGNTYTIAKLADGYYWMTQNLRLGKGNGEEIVLTSSDSNVTSNFTLKASGMGSNSPDATGDCNVGDWLGEGSEEDVNTTHLCINTDDTETYGVYYNWYTATAGTGTYSMSSGDASGSICPKGWILPPNEGERSYYNLLFTKAGLSDDEAGFTTMHNAPYNFPLSGGTNGEGFDGVGFFGGFWSSSAIDSGNAYYLGFSSSRIYPHVSGAKGIGNSVRCVFDDRLTMQSIAVSDLAEGEEITAIDARDGKDYTIKKINGYLWMTQNLRFTGTSLDTTNSNVTSDKTLTYYSLNSSDAGSFGAYSSHCDDPNGYNYACIYDSGSATTGVWYNYYAASAGTISTDSNNTAASEDICPKNWHLPTGPNTTSGTDINKLVGNTTSGWQDPTTGLTAFSAVAGGYYNNGYPYNTGAGYWWSATAYYTRRRYDLNYISSNGRFGGGDYYDRYIGYYVRCVRTL